MHVQNNPYAVNNNSYQITQQDKTIFKISLKFGNQPFQSF